MANILLIDDSEVAGCAMHGILGKAGHRCVLATTLQDAWHRLREAVIIDLVLLEPRIEKDTGLSFLQRLRDDPFWKNLPVVIYTTDSEATSVKKALGLRVQNYLIKPYDDSVVYAEVHKAVAHPWRDGLFEEPRAFCAQLKLTPDSLAKMRRQVMLTFDEAVTAFPLWAVERENAEVFELIDALANDAASAGIWAGVEYLRHLRAEAEQGNWSVFRDSAEYLDFASRLIFCQINPTYLPDALKPLQDQEERRQAVEKERWLRADVDLGGPVMTAEAIGREVQALSGCPTIDSADAAFVMAADGRATSLSRVIELTREDPGLCVQVLLAANRLDHDDQTSIEDPTAAVSMLGEIKLNALAKTTLTIPERHLNTPPVTAASYWMFLVGVAKLSHYIAEYLEFNYLAGTAYTAGLTHDIGKLLLLRLHPWGFAAIMHYAHDHKLPLHEAERRFIGCSTRDLAVKFAEQHRLPRVFVNVLRHVEAPQEATENVELVAMVSLARLVCLHNRVGHCGDTPNDSCPPLASTPAWSVLQQRVFPSFDLRKFEADAHAYCRELKMTLTGQPPSYVGRRR